MAPRRPPLKDGAVKAALYARVSTDDGRQTVVNQVRQLRELAAAREFDIFREYTDEETGASATRASFLALLRDARLRRFRVLLITGVKGGVKGDQWGGVKGSHLGPAKVVGDCGGEGLWSVAEEAFAPARRVWWGS